MHLLLLLMTFSAFRPVPNYLAYCLVTEAHLYEQLAQSRYLMVERLGIEPVTFRSLVRRRNHQVTLT